MERHKLQEEQEVGSKGSKQILRPKRQLALLDPATLCRGSLNGHFVSNPRVGNILDTLTFAVNL